MEAPGTEENARRKTTPDRIVAMLTKCRQRGDRIEEKSDEYRLSRNDTDTDTDPDPDGSRKEALTTQCTGLLDEDQIPSRSSLARSQ